MPAHRYLTLQLLLSMALKSEMNLQQPCTSVIILDGSVATWSKIIQLPKLMSCHPLSGLLVPSSASMVGRSKDIYLMSYIRSTERGELIMYSTKICNTGAVC